MNLIRAGSSLLLAEPPLHKPHLWFVLTDPVGKPPRVVAVMLRTVTRFTDPILVLTPGEHPFIRHDSAVHYSMARWLPVPSLLAAMKDGKCHLKEDMTHDLLRRVRQGLLQSPFTVNALREECAELF
jgi:hypothetical protein